jgi:hypothetical protein
VNKIFNSAEKEMTVPGMPVGAGTEQSPKTNILSIAQDEDDCNPIAYAKLKSAEMDRQVNGIHPYKGSISPLTMNDIFSLTFTRKPPVIDGLLYPGVYILAGAPKIGKSFLSAQIAYHVSMGIPLWDLKVNQGDVLYFALEDDFERIQSRTSTMFGVEGTDKLNFCITSRTIGDGLEDQMEHFIAGHPNTNLIIIDTLQKVRENTGEGYSYASDYEVISALKHFADIKGICIIAVHHTRKQKSEDVYEMISGTTGILGSADGAMVLTKEKRTDKTACLSVVGRDIPDQKFRLERNPDTLCWEMTDQEIETFEKKINPELLKVVDMLTGEKTEWRGSPAELVEESRAEVAPNIITKMLNVNASELKNQFGIEYETGRTSEKRWIHLVRISPENDSNDSNDGSDKVPKQLSQPSQLSYEEKNINELEELF